VANADGHVTTVAALANVFNDPQTIPQLASATDADEVRRIFDPEGLAPTGQPAVAPDEVAQ
jgi:ascorbate PTS system EIIA or EIIAB component